MYPTKRLSLIVAIPALLALGLLIDDSYWWALLVIDATALFIIACDAWWGWQRGRRLSASLQVLTTWSRGRYETVSIAVEQRGRRQLRIDVALDMPRTFTVDGLGSAAQPITLDIPGRSRIDTAVKVMSSERGSFSLNGVHIGLRSPLGLWQRHLHIGASVPIHVQPDLRQLADYALLARTDRLALIGVRRAPRTGGDTEFERLRDYQSGDGLNRMDWKATARRELLTVRDYRTNQSQGLVLMVDAGRMMVSRTGDRNLLDHAIDAALMLAYVALLQGDRVGLIAYADGIKRYVPSGSGPRQMQRLVHALHDLHAERVESRHEEAFLHLSKRERKRSLVIAMTHVLDAVNADHLERHCRRLLGRHLPLAVLLQDHDLHDLLPDKQMLAEALRDNPETLWQAGAAASIIGWRHELIERLRRHGCLVVDTPPEQLTTHMVSRYLEIKARHLL